MKGRLTVLSEAQLVDISPAGIGLEGRESLCRNRPLRLTICGQKGELRLQGTGVWNRLTGTQPADDGDVHPLYRGGVRFDDTETPGTSSDLEVHRFIAVHALESRRTGSERRYLLRPGIGPVNVETRVDFRVKNISASGMLIETDLISEPPSPLHVSLRLPWVSLQLQGRLVRSEQQYGPERRTQLAVEFEGLDDAAQRQIQGLVAEGLGTQAATSTA